MTPYPRIILKPGKEIALQRFHPWIFSGALAGSSGKVEEGDIAEVYSHDGHYLATGHAVAGSIAVKIISFTQTLIDEAFWISRLERALQSRQRSGITDNPHTNAYRLVFGEGDLLPGLIIDYLNGLCVVQCQTVGMYLAQDAIASALNKIYGDGLKAVFSKSAEALSKVAKYEVLDGFLSGSFIPETITENGLNYGLDITGGQKTGFFLDQREHRALLATYARDKKVADIFCYSGGFALNALKAGASLAHAVDSSKKAVALSDSNAALNGFSEERYKGITSDAQSFLANMPEAYDIIILDPPAFAKQQAMKNQAIKGYRNINYLAIKNIKAGGLLFTFSCSQAVDAQSFRSAVMAAAVDAGRPVRVMHHLSQPADHASNLFHPEGEYLKGLVLEVI